MRTTSAIIALAALPQCSHPQPGCTPENCELVRNLCLAEPQAVPTGMCAYTGDFPADIEQRRTRYCVDACNADIYAGPVMQCLADSAGQCQAVEQVTHEAPTGIYAACAPEPLDAGVSACEQACQTVSDACDDQCSGGHACESCRRFAPQGGCSGVCPDAGWVTCADCSFRCHLEFLRCRDTCPLMRGS
jgi:hypothetical protein